MKKTFVWSGEEKLSKRSEGKKRRGKRRIRISSLSHCAVRSNGDQKDGRRTGTCRGNVIFCGCAFADMARRSPLRLCETYSGLVSCLLVCSPYLFVPVYRLVSQSCCTKRQEDKMMTRTISKEGKVLDQKPLVPDSVKPRLLIFGIYVFLHTCKRSDG